jgi:hypothetical protein
MPGWLPTTPPLTDGQATSKHEATPWSVPRLPFSYTRRPNSENRYEKRGACGDSPELGTIPSRL